MLIFKRNKTEMMVRSRGDLRDMLGVKGGNFSRKVDW